MRRSTASSPRVRGGAPTTSSAGTGPATTSATGTHSSGSTRALPEGEQIDIAEVMEISDGLIQSHRIYWGWFGTGELVRSAMAKATT